ncbi:lysophospholipid acyltransferase 6-like [Paramacrobiotus metropolitanus]|uniref:lysophospholipid acyltransferase 6-like n=1 Tax=Paramacrobiotus metropolitanus TaxID=2943436 RepID=UPI002445AB03|nr:lysophospholipid acyltransferase 6-like [Paramacrobiotus metropolitanus]
MDTAPLFPEDLVEEYLKEIFLKYRRLQRRPEPWGQKSTVDPAEQSKRAMEAFVAHRTLKRQKVNQEYDLEEAYQESSELLDILESREREVAARDAEIARLRQQIELLQQCQPNPDDQLNWPMMVIVQKITAYVFAAHDGGKDPTRLMLPDQPRHAIRTPNYWEFLSYVFSFQSLLCGPFCFYDEYMDFIEGNSIEPSSYKKTEDAVKKVPTLSEGSKASQSTEQVTEAEMLPPPQYHPSPLWPDRVYFIFFYVDKESAGCSFVCYLHIMLVPGVPLDLLTEESSLSKLTVIQLMFYLLIGTTFVRFKYYVGWLLSDAVVNASGLGFNGYDELGKPKFDLVSNVGIIEFEFNQNMRSALTAWNSCTARWLRYVAYDRARFLPMMATYTLSAFCLGFYPGYYVTFISAALFTEAARWARRFFRPPFQKWKNSRVVYDFMTFLTIRLCLTYVTFPFVLLEFRYSWIIYKALYFHFHVLALLAVFVLPFFLKSDRKPVKDLGSQKKVDGDAPKSPSSVRVKPEQRDEGVRHRNMSPA